MSRYCKPVAYPLLIAAVLAFATSAGATSLEETHAYLEGQRTITDGQVEPASRVRQAVSAPAPRPTVADRAFLAELARTDGNTEPVVYGTPSSISPFAWIGSIVRLAR